MQIVNNLTNHSANSSLYSSSSAQDIQINFGFIQCFLIVFLSCFCFVTVFGNGLVIYAVIQERYLKSGMWARSGSSVKTTEHCWESSHIKHESLSRTVRCCRCVFLCITIQFVFVTTHLDSLININQSVCWFRIKREQLGNKLSKASND